MGDRNDELLAIVTEFKYGNVDIIVVFNVERKIQLMYIQGGDDLSLSLSLVWARPKEEFQWIDIVRPCAQSGLRHAHTFCGLPFRCQSVNAGILKLMMMIICICVWLRIL